MILSNIYFESMRTIYTSRKSSYNSIVCYYYQKRAGGS